MIALIIVLGLVGLTYLFLSYYPPFGKMASKERLSKYEQSENFSHKRKFVNRVPTIMENSFKETVSILIDFIKGNPNGRPKNAIPIEKLKLSDHPNDTQPKITWFGHSALLLELDEKRILLDPMFGGAPTPFPIFGIKRYSKGIPFIIEDLPTIDIVIISHDHYDHLDYGSIRKIKEKVKQFIVPLGVGCHLEKWGVNPEIIIELDWWDELHHEGLKIASTPARHFSGRSLTDRDTTLWCSWVIKGEDTNIFFSGDSGYGPHFKEIGAKYGPFDLTLMECGQYDRRWAEIHMTPEESVQAHLDVKGKIMIPIHWGAFTLALHDWTDPIERVTKAAQKERLLAISTPRIGETVYIDSEDYPRKVWWK
ncbi:MBL fold metallo-hydrolase [Bacillus sp. ISL-7]|nr:MBL fold metallo-hydrolase [Bacillus sp. ISL-7]